MSVSIADPAAAIAGIIKDDFGSLVSDRIYRPRLPDTDVFRKQMPQGVIEVTAAGGYQRYGGSRLPLVDPRVLIKVYGKTEQHADNIARQIAAGLRQVVRRESRGARIDSVNVTGPMPLIDPESFWPYSLVSAQVTMIEQTVT